MPLTNREISVQYQQRFDFYFLALSLTVVALAVETASFGRGVFPDAMELLGWVVLLLSAFFGLLRIEIIPALYRSRAQLDDQEKELERLQNLKRSGEPWLQSRKDGNKVSVESEIQFFEDLISRNRETLSTDEAKLIPRYRLQRWLLISGVAMLAGARSVPGLETIWQAACT